MPKRNDKGRFTRCYNPVSKTRVVVEPEPYYAPPGRWGMDWAEIGEGLEHRANYDPETIALIRKRWGSVAAFIKHALPLLNEWRQRALIQRIESITHAKQRAAGRREDASAIPVFAPHRARRLTKRERLGKRDAVKRLKQLLKPK